jgi:hypothetical protein
MFVKTSITLSTGFLALACANIQPTAQPDGFYGSVASASRADANSDTNIWSTPTSALSASLTPADIWSESSPSSSSATNDLWSQFTSPAHADPIDADNAAGVSLGQQAGFTCPNVAAVERTTCMNRADYDDIATRVATFLSGLPNSVARSDFAGYRSRLEFLYFPHSLISTLFRTVL